MNKNLENHYRAYRNILTRVLRSAKKRYFSEKFTSVARKFSKSWQVIKEVLNRDVNRSTVASKLKSPDKDEFVTNNKDTAETFCQYSTNIGPSLASKITCDFDFEK